MRRPTGHAVAEAYYATAGAKTNYMRPDTLALLLALANVGAHARVLVVEACGGLVTAATLERTGGAAAPGSGVVSAWVGGAAARRPPLDMWKHFNFAEEQRAALRFAPLQTLLAEAQQAAAARQQQAQQQQEQQQEQPEQQQQEPEQQVQEQEQAQPQEAEPMQQDEQPGAPSEAAAAGAPADAAQQTQAEAQAPLAGSQQPPSALQAPFNCCILACTTVSPLALVRHVLPLLAPSASLAVYSPWPQPLAEALEALRGGGQVANLALQEAWWREMQVLPLRTHPTMNMNHGGGFLLSGTVLAPQQ